MNAKRVNAAAGVIHGSQIKGKQTAAGIAADLELACMLQSPEVATEQVELRVTLEKRTELLRIVQAMARRQTKEIAGRKAYGDQLKAENTGLTAELHQVKQYVRAVEKLLSEQTPFWPQGCDAVLLAIAWLHNELDSCRGRVESAEAYARRTDGRMRALLVEPSNVHGCALCGAPQDGHGVRVTDGFEHEWKRSTDALVRERQLMQQALERSASGAPAESELRWLRSRVAELLAERHSTNESLDDAVQKLRELEKREAVVAEFVADRAGYVVAIRNCHPDNGHDYDRWQGHAAARRQLAEKLGLPVAWPPEDAASADKLTRLLAPTQALSEEEAVRRSVDAQFPKVAEFLREDEPTAVCRCDKPGADPYSCEADDCSGEFSELNPFAGSSGPVEGRDAKVSRTCGCGFRTTVWHVGDGSAEAELHEHVTRVHGGTYPAETGGERRG